MGSSGERPLLKELHRGYYKRNCPECLDAVSVRKGTCSIGPCCAGRTSYRRSRVADCPPLMLGTCDASQTLSGTKTAGSAKNLPCPLAVLRPLPGDRTVGPGVRGLPTKRLDCPKARAAGHLAPEGEAKSCVVCFARYHACPLRYCTSNTPSFSNSRNRRLTFEGVYFVCSTASR
ncbi:MAG: hypothetical protein QOC84_2126 [Bradyrhizobium sp.]|jgi:hypothetical protein|nr:hypothetical protein [Bradyrhizobium sp.]